MSETALERLLRGTNLIIPRYILEVRHIQGKAVLFSGETVDGVAVDKDGRVSLSLNYSDKMSTVEEYHSKCLRSSDFQGFVFVIITTTVDDIQAIELPGELVARKMVLFKPSHVVDFTLCVLMMYMENFPTEAADSAMFNSLRELLKTIQLQLNGVNKMRSLLFRGCTWLLNTLMNYSNLVPFEERYVLPLHGLYKTLIPVTGAQELLKVMFSSHHTMNIGNLPAVNRRQALLLYRASYLNRIYDHHTYLCCLYYWWNMENRIEGHHVFFTM
ncbi:tegument protein UL7 [Testudinid alphaherpesvirus 3]|uniref:Tegument protein n=1 Tax=Testudinid alphaherpesvirus 3 TaxID=2560801 RepID=A0A0K1R1B0_9ALPH|nr:tegument protein UL7 [Testudinid alphaherpesvirus 3]AIU39288.1 tegument protein UL7 [Testudinid alphaherpesvirus 3]AIU39398.1 tegument protein UL7 [Testudinid alphaherpesvirus 3]AKI81674.1 tegument protein UL7 [Testudinid alphaherpesvirus 3]AKI81777.1 tegument protein UL7 [Testudinid alphaherpesvirus 3]AKV40678.1 tegument protein [Testudinid alphaherpesvirus 3]